MTDSPLIHGLLACSERVDTLLSEMGRTEVRPPWRGQAEAVARALRGIRRKVRRNLDILRAGSDETPEFSYQLQTAYQQVQGLSDMWVHLRYPAAEIEGVDALVRGLVRELVPPSHGIHPRLFSSVHHFGGFLLCALKTDESRSPLLLNSSYLHRQDVLSQALLPHEVVHGLYPDLEGTVDEAVRKAVHECVAGIRAKAYGQSSDARIPLLRAIEVVTNLWVEWRDEVAADVGAVYLAGPAYALAFAREFAQDPLDEVLPEHPPRRVRWIAIQAALEEGGFLPVLPELFEEHPPPEYSAGLLNIAEYEYLTRPSIVTACVAATTESLRRLGCKAYDRSTWDRAIEASPGECRIVDILNQAGSRLREGTLDPAWSFAATEELRRKVPTN